MASFAPTADLRSGRGRTAPFAPTAFPTKGNCKEFACHSIRDHLDGHLYTELVEGDLFDVRYEEEEE